MLVRSVCVWAAALFAASVVVDQSEAYKNPMGVRMHPRSSHNSSHPKSKTLDVSSSIDRSSKNAMTEGESHNSPDVPEGSILTTLPVSISGAEVAVYWTKEPQNKSVEHAFIMVHGKLRDGDRYWTIMNDALQSAVKDNYKGANNNSVIVAPQFYSTKLNKGQYSDKTLAWGDVNAWQAGSVATHPKNTPASSVDAIDAIIDHFTDNQKYPNLRNITLVGHGGGAQLMNRYATVGKDGPKNVHVRYVVGDPSSSAYFTEHRPVTDKSIASIDKCPEYNDWRYGFASYPGTLSSNKSTSDYFSQYINRDVVNIVGYKDTLKNGDQKCMALLQGGQKRRDRNLSWWRYINMLGATNENLDGFPGNFSNLPDWSHHSNGVIKTRLCVVEDASHDAAKVFGSKEGRSALFNDYDVEMGWRPQGWSYRASKPISNKNASNSTSSTSSTSPSSTSSSHSGADASHLPQLSVSNDASRTMMTVASVLAPAAVLFIAMI
ncbi:hypothetical protein ACI68E_004297 [Malassezia pachydermatis]